MSKATGNGFTVEFFATSLTPEQTAAVDRQLTPDAIAELLAEAQVSECNRDLSSGIGLREINSCQM
jgi:hypothetical protein